MHKHSEIEQTYIVEGSFYDHDGICRADEFFWWQCWILFTRPIPTKGRDPADLPQAKRLPAQPGYPQRRAITRQAIGLQIPTKSRRCLRDDVACLAAALTLPAGNADRLGCLLATG